MTFEILFWYSNWFGKSYFDTQNPILTFELSRKIVIWHSKSYFDNRTESENATVFWHSNWVGKSYFENSSLSFELRWKMLFWYSYFDIRTESENRILTFKILFWLSKWVGISYFDIQNPILTFELSRKIVFWH